MESGSDAGFQFADDSERRSSLPRQTKRLSSKVLEDDDQEGDEEDESRGNKKLPGRRSGRPRKSTTPNKSTSNAMQDTIATPTKSSAKSARGGKSARGRGGKKSTPPKMDDTATELMSFYQSASQPLHASQGLHTKSSDSLPPLDPRRLSSLKPAAIEN